MDKISYLKTKLDNIEMERSIFQRALENIETKVNGIINVGEVGCEEYVDLSMSMEQVLNHLIQLNTELHRTSSTLFGTTQTSTSTHTGGSSSGIFGQPTGRPSAFGLERLGIKSSEEEKKQNVLRTPHVFGNTSTQNNSANSARSTNTGGFSAGGVGVAATGFNVSSQQTTGTPSAFGSVPSFGASPSFRAPPDLGAALPGPNTGSFGNRYASSAAPTFEHLAQSGGGFDPPASQSFEGNAFMLGQSNASSGFGSHPQVREGTNLEQESGQKTP